MGLLTAEVASRLPAARITAVEIVPEAVADAEKLMNRLGLYDRVREVCADAAEFMRNGFSERGEGGRRVVLLDPPRKGCAPEVVAAVNASDCEKVVYISCNPFAEGGFTLSHIQPFDMFPETMCLETLVLLSHKEPDSRISVKVEFGEKEGQISLAETQKQVEDSKPKSKTTYKQIQKYVEENYGFKVHTAYIAEVKRNLGLPMYDAPNAVEELKRPRSHPTEKMVLAIKETLAHFEII